MSDFTEKLKIQFTSDNFLVIDIGIHGMKVMEVKRKSRDYYIKKVFTMPEMSKYFTGPDMFNVNGIVDSMSQIIHLERIKTKNVFLSFSSAKLQTKIINIPELPEKEIRTFVELEYQKQFPNLNKLTDVVDYMPLGTFIKEGSNQKQLSLLLAQYSVIDAERVVKEFKNKKYNVNIIDVGIHGLGNVGRIYNDLENRDIVVFDIGYNTSQMVFLRDQTVVFSRNLAFGTNTIIKGLQNQEEITNKEAESILHEVGLQAKEDIIKGNRTIFADDYNEMVEGYLTNTLNEAYRSFQSVNSTYGLNLSHVLLTGGFSAIPDSKELVQKILEMDVETWEMDDSDKIRLSNGSKIVNQTDKVINGAYATCVGMAIRGNFE
ncbi:pilus assembly protein PilM [Bacillus cereus]|uniref:pilus assembly protein PilM n=1 Tax=Bacillus cereus TaxID=1396 RepID=UPI003079097A